MKSCPLTHGFFEREVELSCLKPIATQLIEMAQSANDSITYISSLHKIFPGVEHLINLSVYHKACRILNEKRLNLENVELHYMPAGSEPIPCHQDNFYHCVPEGRGIKILIPLTDLSTTNGALHFLDCDSSIGVLEHRPSSVMNFSAYIDQTIINSLKVGITKYKYKMGDASYHLLNFFHFSCGNQSDQSSAFIVFRYQPPNIKQCEQMLNAYRDCYSQHVKIKGHGSQS